MPALRLSAVTGVMGSEAPSASSAPSAPSAAPSRDSFAQLRNETPRGVGSRVQGFGFRVQVSFRVWGAGGGAAQGLKIRTSLDIRVQGSGFRVQALWLIIG